MKIKTGIVGLGGLGKIHGHHLACELPQVELTAACSVVPGELTWARDTLGVTQCFASYDEMIDKADIEAVVIVSPSRLHAAQIEKAWLAGKHVFAEKPLGVTVDECLHIEQLIATRPSQYFTLGFMRRYDKSNAYAKKRIDAGDIGKPYLVKATTIDPAQDVEACINFSCANPGMLFIGLGVHDIDLLHWFMGSPPLSVYATGGVYANQGFADIPDPEAGCAMYTFENEGMAFQHVGRAAPHGYHIETEIVGTQGSIRVSPIPQKNLALLYSDKGVVIVCVRDYKERFRDAYKDELADFFDCITQGRKPAITAHDGTVATQIAMATTRSFEQRAVVNIEY